MTDREKEQQDFLDRQSMFDLQIINGIVYDKRQAVIKEIEGWLVELEKLNGGEVMWIKLYPIELDGDHILLGNWFRAKLQEMKGMK